MLLQDIFSEFKSNKSIDLPTMVRVLEDVFRTLIKKKYGSDENFDVIVNAQKGDLELWRVREIVPDGEVTDDRSQISISEALSIDEDYEIGEECYEQLYLEDFGRRAIMAARQTLISRILDLEKDEIYRKYNERVGEVILGEVHQILKREILVLDDVTGHELIMPRNQTIRGDFFRKGDMVRGVISEVKMRNNNPQVILSRTANEFLEKRKDISPYEKLFDSGLPAEQINLNDVNFKEQDIFAMDFPKASFDGILINAAFEHLDYARGKEFLEKIKSFMKPGAIMFAVFDKVATGKKGEFEVLEDGTHQYIDKFRDGMFLRNYSDEELKELLLGANWEILDIKKNKMESRIVVARNKPS